MTSGGKSSGTRIRQFCKAVKAAALTRCEVSGGLPSVSSPATQTRSASMTGFEQQQPVLSTRAAAYRTHSFGSARSPLISAMRASFQRLQSTVPRYSMAVDAGLGIGLALLDFPGHGFGAHGPALILHGRECRGSRRRRADRGDEASREPRNRPCIQAVEHLAELRLAELGSACLQSSRGVLQTCRREPQEPPEGSWSGGCANAGYEQGRMQHSLPRGVPQRHRLPGRRNRRPVPREATETGRARPTSARERTRLPRSMAFGNIIPASPSSSSPEWAEELRTHLGIRRETVR